MKTFTAIVFTSSLILFSNFINAQDRIIKRNGDTLKVAIIRSTPDIVEFTYPNETAINSEYNNSLSKLFIQVVEKKTARV